MVSPEIVQEKWSEITDMTNAKSYASITVRKSVKKKKFYVQIKFEIYFTGGNRGINEYFRKNQEWANIKQSKIIKNTIILR